MTRLDNDSEIAALTKCLRANPLDVVNKNALRDKLREVGVSPRAADKLVQGVIDAAVKMAHMNRAVEALALLTRRGARLRKFVKQSAGVLTPGHRTIEVELGEAHPVAVGEVGYSTFPNGTRASHPRAAIKAGYRLTYHPSTFAIRVGAEWVTDAMESGLVQGWVADVASHLNHTPAEDCASCKVTTERDHVSIELDTQDEPIQPEGSA